MSRNIVIFGPAHAGKSTLAGFLIAGHQPEDLARVKIMLSSGQHGEISEADKYRLLLDKHDEERRRNREPGHGTSWYMHTAPTRIGHFDFLLIDTPGREHER
jgi:translation elongation factor EF-1alpha